MQPWKHIAAALAAFVVAALYLLFLSGYWYLGFGSYGLLFSELTILGIALVAALLCRDKLCAVFPFPLPTLRQSIGALLLWAGVYPLILVVTVTLAILFPQSMAQTATEVGGLGVQMPLAVQLAAMALLPAVCEEALLRGFIQYHMGVVRVPWVRFLIVGTLFGILHMDLRIAGTALVGIALCYARERGGSLFYPMLMHFTNNALSVLVSQSANDVATDAELYGEMFAAMTPAAVGVLLPLAAFTPWLLWAGDALLRPQNAPRTGSNGKKVLFCALTTVVCIALGVVLVMVEVFTGLA